MSGDPRIPGPATPGPATPDSASPDSASLAPMTPAQVNVRLGQIPFFRFLGLSFTAIAADEAEAVLPFAERLIGNPVREHYHGGIIASFMEAVAAITVAPDLPGGRPAKPINLTIDYLRPAVRGPLMARAAVMRRGRRMASLRSIAWQDDPARPVAEGLYHFLLV